MTNALVAAGSALLGVIVGGLVAWWREARQRRADMRRGRRLAARVLFDELMWEQAGVSRSLAAGEWNAASENDGATLREAWRERRDALHTLSTAEWNAIFAATVGSTIPNGKKGTISDRDRDLLERQLAFVEKAKDALRTYR